MALGAKGRRILVERLHRGQSKPRSCQPFGTDKRVLPLSECEPCANSSNPCCSSCNSPCSGWPSHSWRRGCGRNASRTRRLHRPHRRVGAQGAQALQVEWQPPPHPLRSSREILDSLAASAQRAARGETGFGFRDRGDVAPFKPLRRPHGDVQFCAGDGAKPRRSVEVSRSAL